MMNTRIKPRLTRSLLLSLLSEACELEHGLACSYLFAAFSLRREPGDGLTWDQCQELRLWAAQVYFVASQEMLHLAQAWNLLTAVGGSPWWSQPSFPQSKGYVPIEVELTLERYSSASLSRFIAWERPRRLLETHTRMATPRKVVDSKWDTIGGLYDLILEIILSVPEQELFIGDPAVQIGPALADFPDLIRVVDRSTACEAIRRIQDQGEGTPEDRQDCHHGVFIQLEQMLANWYASQPTIEPSFAVLPNPNWRNPPLGADAAALAAMHLFDDLYEIMLRMLAWVFAQAHPEWPETQKLASLAIRMMPVIIEPLGRTLARIPLCAEGVHAGASFSLRRPVALPESRTLAVVLVRERLLELSQDAVSISQKLPNHPQIAALAPVLTSYLREL